jgi:serine phosphatase RsbU (regulator of sigma subunit)
MSADQAFEPAGPLAAESLILTIIDSSGQTSQVQVTRSPYRIGRLPECDLSLRDGRISRDHAQILLEDGKYFIEDRESRHGLFVNGQKVTRHELRPKDRIEFGVHDSYQVVVGRAAASTAPIIKRAVEMPSLTETGGLGRLSSVLEVARALQSSLSLDDILATAVDAALVVTGAQRGFLMLKSKQTGLEVRVARSQSGEDLAAADLRIPRGVIQKALLERRDLLSMSLDPMEGAGGAETEAKGTVPSLEIRSVFCVPLVRIRIGQEHETTRLSPKEDTLGVLYMDSREPAGDLSASTRELLQTLAIEISSVLENARLLSEEREKRQLEHELKIARNIQQAMLPPQLPEQGWLVAAGRSVACFDVGGDYFDVMRLSPQHWGAVLADVSGKGVAAALMASLIQGAFFATASLDTHLSEIVAKVNRYISERAANARFVTVFYCSIGEDGSMRWVNAGHCPALVVRGAGSIETLPAGGPPVGLFPDAVFPESGIALSPGDKVVIYSDGVSEAHNAEGQEFGEKRLVDAVTQNASRSAGELFLALESAITSFTAGAPQKDDLTLLVLGYQGPGAAG